MGASLEIDQAEAFDAVPVRHAGHGEDIGLRVDLAEFVVGDVAEKFDGEIRPGGRLIQCQVIVLLAVRADEPVFDSGALVGGQALERCDDFKLTLARVEPGHGEDDGPSCARHGAREGAGGQVGAQGTGSDDDFVRHHGKMFLEQFAGIGADDAEAGGFPEEVGGAPA